jgi:ribosomal protein RSM22 (predicted rRNA methylase)
MLIKNLFPRPEKDTLAMLDRFHATLSKTFPLKGKHREVLHKNVRDLSDSLTSDRESLKKDYMGDARLLGAYLHYFLPWNLYRMSRLFSGINPSVRDNGTIIDLGSGPMTVPLAMWMSMPALRDRKLTFVCVDRAPKVMNEGRKLFDRIAGPKAPWRIVTVKGSLGMKLREKGDLVVAANTLNELNLSARGKQQDPMGKLARTLRQYMAENGRLLLIEPGLRRSGETLSALRGLLLEQGLSPLAPCTHAGECPMTGLGKSPWCHFNFGIEGAPGKLMNLTRRARLTKTGLSLSFLYMSEGEAEHAEAVRVISEPFPLPEGRGQYGCSDRGLTLLHYPATGPLLYPGQFIVPHWPEETATDAKSGAVVLPVAIKQGKKK